MISPLEKVEHTASLLKETGEHIITLVNKRLWLKALIAMVLGVLTGIILGPDLNLITPENAAIITEWLALPGNIFLQLIKMIIIPLIFSSIIVGMLSSGGKKYLKKIGPRLALYFVITTSIAIIIGMGMSFLISPGNYIDISQINFGEQTSIPTPEGKMTNIPSAVVNIIPSNPFQAIVNGDMLGVVIFTIISGIGLLFITREKHLKTTMYLLETIQDVAMRIVKWAMLLVPIAVFGLIAEVVSKIGMQSLKGLGMYIVTVLAALAVLGVFYFLIVWLLARRNPFKFFANIRDAQLLAFSTSSSAATMPLSMKVAEDKLKIRPAISRFIIPIGATINMDGTALYQAVATIFLAQAFGVHLSLTSLLIIMAISVGASIGAPAVPGVGIVILATILDSVGIPAVGIALVLGVDRILDMSRTSMNVTGDLTACMFFDRNLAYLFKRKRKGQKI